MSSSILPVAGNDKGRNRKSQQINTWLQARYHQQILEVFDHVFTQHRAFGNRQDIPVSKEEKDFCTGIARAH